MNKNILGAKFTLLVFAFIVFASAGISAQVHNKDYYYGRARWRLTTGDNAGALEDLNLIVSLTPNDPKAYNTRGIIYERCGDYSAARADYEHALWLNPDSAEAKHNINNLNEKLNGVNLANAGTAPPVYTQSQPVQRVTYTQARPVEQVPYSSPPVQQQGYTPVQSVRQQNYTQVLPVEQVTYSSPPVQQQGYTPVQSVRQQSYTQGRPVEQVAYTSSPVQQQGYTPVQSVRQQQNYTQVRPVEQVTYTSSPVQQQGYTQARPAEQVTYGSVQTPENRNILNASAVNYNRSAMNIGVFRQTGTPVPVGYSGVLQPASLLSGTGIYGQEAYRGNSSKPFINAAAENHNNYGVTLNGAGRFDEAIVKFTEAIDAYPEYAIAYNNRGVAYAAIGDFVRATEDFIKALRINPYYYDAQVNYQRINGSMTVAAVTE